MYKIIKSNQTLTLSGTTVQPFFIPEIDEETLFMKFETYEDATNHIAHLQKIKKVQSAYYQIVEETQ